MHPLRHDARGKTLRMTLVCDCGSDRVIAVAPGVEDEAAEIGGVRVVTQRGTAIRVYCFACWPCSPRQPDLFSASEEEDTT